MKKYMKYTMALLGALLMPLSFLNAQYYVSKDGADSNDGLSWSTAFASLRKASATAPESAEIRVAKGVYTEATLVPKNGQAFYGGYAGEGEDPDAIDFIENKTTLAIEFYASASAFDLTLDGFTFTSAGRIVLNNPNASIINGRFYVNNCYFETAKTAIHTVGMLVYLHNVSIKSSSAADPAIQSLCSIVNAYDTTIYGGSSAINIGNIIQGGFSYYIPWAYLFNCTFANSSNSAVKIIGIEFVDVHFTNCIVWTKGKMGVAASPLAFAASPATSSRPATFGINFYSSVVKGEYSGTGETGYINADPLVGAMEWKSGIVPTCRIGKNSSARDIGAVYANMRPADIKGVPRPLDSGVDAGALQYNDVDITKDLSPIDGYIGKDAVLAVECNEAYQQTYQWQKYAKNTAGKWVWSDIEGATANSYTVENIDGGMAGQKYRCAMFNVDGPVYSKEAAVTIRQDADILEPIPSPAVGYNGRTATISVAAAGYKPSYQWKSWDEALQDWVDVDGANTAKLTIKNVDPSMDGTKYMCVVSNGGNTATSETTFEVRDNLSILEQPKSIDIYTGKNGVFNILADGYNTKYAWYVSKNGGAKWSAVSGGNKQALTISKADAAMSGYLYYCKVYNDKGSLISDEAGFLNVREPAAFVSADRQYQDGATLLASGDGFDLNYQWQTFENGQWKDIEGSTAANFIVPANSESAGKAFRCEISNTTERLNPVYSNEIWANPSGGISNFDALTPQATYDGDAAVFSINLQSSTKYKYTWYVRASAEAPWKKTGSNSATLKVSKPKTTAHGSEYKCVLQFADQTVETKAVSLTVNGKVKIATQTKSATSFDGQNVTFSVAATGHQPNFQWQKYTKNEAGKWVWVDIEGASSSSYTISNIEYSQNGEKYRCEVSNTGNRHNAKYSGIMKLAVKQTVSIAAEPLDLVAATGASASFSVKAAGASKITYQWYQSLDDGLSWSSIDKAKSAKYTMTKLAKDKDGMMFYCKASNGGGFADSAWVKLTVYQKTTPDALPKKFVLYPGGSIELDVLAEPGSTYVWEAKLPKGKDWFTVYANDITFFAPPSKSFADLYLSEMTVFDAELQKEVPFAPVDGMKLRCTIISPHDQAVSKETTLTLIKP